MKQYIRFEAHEFRIKTTQYLMNATVYRYMTLLYAKKIPQTGSTFQINTSTKLILANLKHDLHANKQHNAAGNHISKAGV